MGVEGREGELRAFGGSGLKGGHEGEGRKRGEVKEVSTKGYKKGELGGSKATENLSERGPEAF